MTHHIDLLPPQSNIILVLPFSFQDMKANDIKIIQIYQVYSLQDSLPLDATSHPKLRSEFSSDNSKLLHTFWVASEQLTINPTLSQTTGFAHPSFTCNTETQRNISDRLHVYATHTLSDD